MKWNPAAAFLHAGYMLGVCATVCLAQQSPTVVATVTSSRPLSIDGVSMSPTASSSWPLVDRDELTTEASALMTATDRNRVVFDAASAARVNATESTPTFIYLRQGGLSFDARTERFPICAANRLFIPEKLATGILRLQKDGSVFERLDRGTFVENGTRACSEEGAGTFLSGLPVAAGGTITTSGAGAASRGVALAAGAALVGVGAAVATGALSSASPNPCPAVGCNTNPADISPIQP